MKYGIRNTLILILTLILMAGGGWLYIQNRFNTDIEEAEIALAELNTELQDVQQSANMFAQAQANYNEALYVRLNHPKELFVNHSSSALYNYLQELNRDLSFTGLNYS